MEENKYFTPNREDLRIGYECELKIPTTDWFKHDTWKPFILEDRSCQWGGDCSELDDAINKIRLGETRTPYLTKEQIEAEGWKLTKDSQDEWDFQGKQDGNSWWELHYDNFLNSLTVEFWKVSHRNNSWDAFTRFEGKCPSINEFRQISKLLSIK